MSKKVIHTEKAPQAVGPYSQAIEKNGMLYISGQIPINPETGKMPEGITVQTEQVMKNIGAILKEAGYGFEQVVKSTCLLTDMADFKAMNEGICQVLSYESSRQERLMPLKDCLWER